MISDLWTLNGSSAAAQNLSGFTLSLNSQAPSTLRFIEHVDQDQTPAFAYGDAITLAYNGTTVFNGKIYNRPRRATATSELVDYIAMDAWRDLERCIFQQNWRSTNGTTSELQTVSRSRFVIGQDIDGEAVDNTDTITEALDWAIARGVALQAGDTVDAVKIPWDEDRDRSVAEILIRILRWSPDAVTHFDYTTTPPTLHIRRRAHANVDTHTLTIDGTSVETTDITPLYDLQVPAVVLKFERTHSVDGESYTTVDTQIAPGTATGLELGALVMTLELSGSQATYNKYTIETDDIDESTLSWWEEKYPWLADGTDVTIEDGTVVRADGDEEGDIPDNELLDGSLPPNLANDAVPVIVTAKLSGTWTNPDTGATVTKIKDPISVNLVATDYSTRTFSQLASLTVAEPTPTGLAAHLYAALSTLQHKGTVKTIADEISTTILPGDLIDLDGPGADPAWSSIAAQVQSIVHDIDNGATTYNIGPAAYLSASDIVELARASRGRLPTITGLTRATATPAQESADGVRTPNTNSTGGPSYSAAAPDHPYKISIRENPSSPGNYQAKVIAQSRLFDALDPATEITITNLDTWFTLLGFGTDEIWVTGTIGTWPAVTGAAIESYGQSDTWDGGVVEHDGASSPVQTKFRRLIATIDCDVTPPVVAVQHVRDHLTLRNIAYSPAYESDGTGAALVPAVYPLGG